MFFKIVDYLNKNEFDEEELLSDLNKLVEEIKTLDPIEDIQDIQDIKLDILNSVLFSIGSDNLIAVKILLEILTKIDILELSDIEINKLKIEINKLKISNENIKIILDNFLNTRKIWTGKISKINKKQPVIIKKKRYSSRKNSNKRIKNF